MGDSDEDIVKKFMTSIYEADDLFSSSHEVAGYGVEEGAVDFLREEFAARRNNAASCLGLFKLLLNAVDEAVVDDDFLPDLVDLLELDPRQMMAFDQALALADGTPEISQMFTQRRRM